MSQGQTPQSLKYFNLQDLLRRLSHPLDLPEKQRLISNLGDSNAMVFSQCDGGEQ